MNFIKYFIEGFTYTFRALIKGFKAINAYEVGELTAVLLIFIVICIILLFIIKKLL